MKNRGGQRKPLNADGTKTCPLCKLPLSIEKFSIINRKGRTPTRHTYCRHCKYVKYNKFKNNGDYYTPEKRAEYMRKYNASKKSHALKII